MTEREIKRMQTVTNNLIVSMRELRRLRMRLEAAQRRNQGRKRRR